MRARPLDVTHCDFPCNGNRDNSNMFLDLSHYPYLSLLVENVDYISAELQSALRENSHVKNALLTYKAMDYPSNQWTWDNAINTAAVGYDLREGSYTMLSIHKTGHEIDIAPGAFPKTLALLKSVPGIEYACISALSPKAHIALHTHSRRHYIFHLLLNNLIGGSCEIICNKSRKEMKSKGDSVLFDYSFPHESTSYAENIRFNLMVDFFPD